MRTSTPRLVALMMIAIAWIAADQPATAAEIALYEFTGASAVSTDTEANSTAANFLKNPATADWGFSGGGNVFARSNATTASEANAVAAGDYFSFTVTPDAAYELDLTSLTFDTFHNQTLGAGTPDDPADMLFFVRSSVDGFANNIGATFSQAWNTSTSRTVDLASSPFQDLQTATEFRFYIYDSGINNGFNGARIDNVSLDGLVGLASTTHFQAGIKPTSAYNHDGTWIRSANPTTNFDTHGQIVVGPATSDIIRGLLEFDISSITSTDQIDSASLVLTTASTAGAGGTNTINVYAYGFDINASGSDWNDPDGDGNDGTGDTTAGGTLGALLTSATFDTTSLGLEVTFGDSAAFRAAVANALAGDGILRLILANNNESVFSNFARFVAEDQAEIGDRPELIIVHSAASNPIPTPAALPAGLAMLGLIAARRRRA